MSIKPTDAIIYPEKLVIHSESYRDSLGFYRLDIKYQPFFQKFMDHVERAGRNDHGMYTPYDTVIQDCLEPFNAFYKVPKNNYAGRYIKFRKPADLTYFMLYWS